VVSLLYHDCDPLFILYAIILCPPIVELTFMVVLSALIVKTMGHLVANDSSHGSIIDGIVSFHIEEWRLQDSCREYNFIKIRMIVCIYGLRSHLPFNSISRCIHVFHGSAMIESRDSTLEFK